MKETKFARQFRWTLKPEGHDGVAFFLKRVVIDMFRKRVRIEAMDAVVGDESPVMKWLVTGTESNMAVNFYDGGGDAIESFTLRGVKPLRHRCVLDYGSSKEVLHRCLFSFASVTAVTDRSAGMHLASGPRKSATTGRTLPSSGKRASRRRPTCARPASSTAGTA